MQCQYSQPCTCGQLHQVSHHHTCVDGVKIVLQLANSPLALASSANELRLPKYPFRSVQVLLQRKFGELNGERIILRVESLHSLYHSIDGRNLPMLAANYALFVCSHSQETCCR